ncbi:MAG TPA: hypothetical protein VFT69_03095, partial [Pseudolabrys sp.]|nr:hypothetical protein [Pseudolabrys sp.]
PVIDNLLSTLDHNGVSSTYWAGGPWWGDYKLSIEPENGHDAPQMQVLAEHLADSAPVKDDINSAVAVADAHLASSETADPAPRHDGHDPLNSEATTGTPHGAHHDDAAAGSGSGFLFGWADPGSPHAENANTLILAGNGIPALYGGDGVGNKFDFGVHIGDLNGMRGIGSGGGEHLWSNASAGTSDHFVSPGHAMTPGSAGADGIRFIPNGGSHAVTDTLAGHDVHLSIGSSVARHGEAHFDGIWIIG